MAHQPNPNDPFLGNPADDIHGAKPVDLDMRSPAQLDNDLQVDPDLADGPASGGKIAMLAVAIALILGAVFYGLDNTPVHQAGTSATAQNTAQDSPPAAPSGMRDVTPRSNTQPGMTTGAAPTNPKAPPATSTSGAANSGSTQ